MFNLYHERACDSLQRRYFSYEEVREAQATCASEAKHCVSLLLQADANCIQLPQDIEVARELQTFI